MEVSQENQEEVEVVEQVETPDLIGKSVTEAEKIVKESGLEMVIQNEEEEMDMDNTIIKTQTPQAGIVLNKGNKVYVKNNK